MANPLPIDIPAGAWVKVADNVTSGVIYRMKTGPIYKQTYRTAGEAAPADLSDSAILFDGCNSAEISAQAAIDVYVYCQNDAGKVRVDL